jgi:hypothetical protein
LIRIAVVFLLFTLTIFGQVTSTDTEGKGGIDLFTSWSYYPANINTSTSDTLLLVGLTKRLDFMLGEALNLGGHESQLAVETGLQYKILERGSWNVLTLDLATLPFNDRKSGDGTLFASLTVNKEVSLYKNKFTIYGGYGPTISLGARADKIFSYKNSLYNFPVGVMVPVGQRLQLFAEYGIKRPDYFSLGVSYNIKKSR